MKIVAHCLVRNEENFIWYAINSVLGAVDEVMVWDMESTDKTVETVKLIDSKKIKFKETGIGDSKAVSELRQKMLEETDSDWILILDGDEVWWDGSIQKALSGVGSLAQGVFGMAVPFYNCIGDIYHYQEESAGKYELAGKSGHVNLRFVNCRVDGLNVRGVYPYEYYATRQSQPIQDTGKILFIDTSYLHLTYLKRTSTYERKKEKNEMGIPFPLDFYYPEVFFRPRSSNVNSPWEKMRRERLIKAYIETPFKRLKRGLIR